MMIVHVNVWNQIPFASDVNGKITDVARDFLETMGLGIFTHFIKKKQMNESRLMTLLYWWKTTKYN